MGQPLWRRDGFGISPKQGPRSAAWAGNPRPFGSGNIHGAFVDLVGIAVQPCPSLNRQETVRATSWPKAIAGPYASHIPAIHPCEWCGPSIRANPLGIGAYALTGMAQTRVSSGGFAAHAVRA